MNVIGLAVALYPRKKCYPWGNDYKQNAQVHWDPINTRAWALSYSQICLNYSLQPENHKESFSQTVYLLALIDMAALWERGLLWSPKTWKWHQPQQASKWMLCISEISRFHYLFGWRLYEKTEDSTHGNSLFQVLLSGHREKNDVCPDPSRHTVMGKNDKKEIKLG